VSLVVSLILWSGVSGRGGPDVMSQNRGTVGFACSARSSRRYTAGPPPAGALGVRRDVTLGESSVSVAWSGGIRGRRGGPPASGRHRGILSVFPSRSRRRTPRPQGLHPEVRGILTGGSRQAKAPLTRTSSAPGSLVSAASGNICPVHDGTSGPWAQGRSESDGSASAASQSPVLLWVQQSRTGRLGHLS
jgi:hypothetical protein